MGSAETIMEAISLASQEGGTVVLHYVAAALASLAEHATGGSQEETARIQTGYALAAAGVRSAVHVAPTVREFQRTPAKPRGLAKEWYYEGIALAAVRDALTYESNAAPGDGAEDGLSDAVDGNHGKWRDDVEGDYTLALARHYLDAFRVLTGQEE